MCEYIHSYMYTLKSILKCKCAHIRGYIGTYAHSHISILTSTLKSTSCIRKCSYIHVYIYIYICVYINICLSKYVQNYLYM